MAPTKLSQTLLDQATTAGKALLNAANAAAQRVLLGLTPWVAYAPTFTGFGTVSNVSIWSRRVGDTLHIRGTFTTGTCTATEARMTLGFDGSNGGITSDAAKVPARQRAGQVTQGLNGALEVHVLIEGGVGYVTFGRQYATGSGLTKANGNAAFADATSYSLMAEIPISSW